MTHWRFRSRPRSDGAVVAARRHHDGFALWDTRYGDLNAVSQSPAKRDLLEPFVKALRKNHVRLCLYYSLPDWSYSDYSQFTTKENRYKIGEQPSRWTTYQDYYLQIRQD